MNDFNTKKLDNSSKKILLAKVATRRDVTSEVQTVSAIGHKGIISTPPPVVVYRYFSAKVHVLTRIDSGIPALFEYLFNDLTNELTIHFNYNSDPIVVEYFLYFTNEKDRLLGSDPFNPDVDLKLWKGGIVEFPPVSEDISNIIVGLYSMSTSTLSVANENKELYKYLGTKDSFKEADVSLYMALDETKHLRGIFSGVVTGVSITDLVLSFEIKEIASKLENTVLMGDSNEDCFTSSTHNEVGVPIPLIFGKASRGVEVGRTLEGPSESGVFASSIKPYALNPESMHKAYTSAYELEPTTTNNRRWDCCRVPEFPISLAVTITGRTNITINGVAGYSYTVSNPGRFGLGVTLSNLAKNKFMRVVDYERTAGAGYLHTLQNEFGADPVVGDSMITNAVPTIVLSGGTDDQPIAYLCYGKHYEASYSNTSSGGNLLYVIFNNNFEADPALATFFGDSKVLDPKKHKVHYRVYPNIAIGTHNHAVVLKKILNSAGIPTEDSTFTAMQTTLPVNVCFSVPSVGEGSLGKTKDYVEKILASTLGAIRMNEQLKAEYKLLTPPSSTDLRTDVNIIKDSFGVQVDYVDLHSSVHLWNPEWFGYDADGSSSPTPYAGEKRLFSPKCTTLHKINNHKVIQHALLDITPLVSTFTSLYLERKCKYTLSTKTIDLDTQLHDDVKVEREGLPGGDKSKEVKILGLSKSGKEVSIDAIDLI